jgi:hypothetical protein
MGMSDVALFLESKSFATAMWFGDKLEIYKGCWTQSEVEKLVAFIVAGPSKKRYKITRMFDDKPNVILCNRSASTPMLSPAIGDSYPTELNEEDITEVYE